MSMAGCGCGVGLQTLSPLEGRNGMNEEFVQKKTQNAVTSALPRSRKGPLQESCYFLMFDSEVIVVPHTWAGLHQ